MERSKNAKIIDSKWVFRLKKYSDGQIKEYKARLITKGFIQKKATISGN